MSTETLRFETEDIFPDAYPPDEPPTPEIIENTANKILDRYYKFRDLLPPNLPSDFPLIDSLGNTCEINFTRDPEETGLIQGIFIRKTKFLKSREKMVRYYTAYSLYENYDKSGHEFRIWDQPEGSIESNTTGALNGFLKITDELLSPQENKLNPKQNNNPTVEEYPKSL